MKKKYFSDLTNNISQFPGIGERQAYRIAQFIVRKNKEYAYSLSDSIKKAKEAAQRCPQCKIFHEEEKDICALCEDITRDSTKLTVVEKDIDITAIEKSGVYDGYYFIFGPLIPIKSPEFVEKSALSSLLQTIRSRDISTIILSLSLHPDAIHTMEILANEFKKVKEENDMNFKILTPGRGFSSGLELEYADPETIRYAFQNPFTV